MNEKCPPPGFDPDSITPPSLRDGPWPVLSLALDLAGSCNMACRYCAESATQPRRQPMSPETLEAAWTFLVPDGAPKNGMTIRLGSGEPLLAFPLMKKIKELSPVPVFLTTNGTLIDEEIMEWLITSGWNVKISLDGPESIHDTWRVFPGGGGTYRRIRNTVACLAKKIPGRFSVTAVLCRGTDPLEVFEEMMALGVKRVEFVPAAHKIESVMPGPEDVKRYRKFIMSYAESYLTENRSRPLPGFSRFDDCVLRIMGYIPARVSCGAGRYFFGVGPEGDLYPCFRFIGVDRYRLGSISTGVDLVAAKAFREGAGRSYERRESCSRCWAAPLCAGPCFACSEMFGPGNGEPVPTHCQYTLANAEAAVFLVNELRKRDPERLLSFFPTGFGDRVSKILQ